ncbi:TPA: DUF4406 domain-containing protein [Yersinia enterocolitica]|nr:DUF4406 domain-containing protein [Yersinia enterocolitica]
MKIYIAGPMTGVANDNRDTFNQVAKSLTGRGYIVLNPAALPPGSTQHQYMDICFAMLRAADCIFLLPGWKHSAGATAEYHYGYKMAIPTFNDLDTMPVIEQAINPTLA